ncbi:hypothetical protein L3Y34_010548 [Caenorhabditis briggsae]|nr:hypothetical protein L3Y34_010548 [Caenorhabditis briggsae]
MMNKEVKLPWHAGYCVFDPRQSTMSCYKQEYPFVTKRLLQRNRTVRMDGDRSAFAKHWGLLPDHFGSPISGPHTIARSYTRHPKERIPTKERFFSISRIPSRLTKFSTVRGVPVEFFEILIERNLQILNLNPIYIYISIKYRRTLCSSVQLRNAERRKKDTRRKDEAGRIVIGRPRSPIERRVSASSHSSTGSMHRQGVHPNALHHLLLTNNNKKRSSTTTCAQSHRVPNTYSGGSATSSIPLYVNTQALAAEQLSKAEKRVSFKDLDMMSGRLSATTQQPSSSAAVHLRTGGGLHARKLHRCDTGDMSLLERYLSRENMHTPSPIPLEYHQQSHHSPRHVHFAQTQSRRPLQRDQRDDSAASIRKRLSRSCDHLSDHNFSPRLPPIRRKPTKHVPQTLSLVIHGTLCFLDVLCFVYC